ALWATTDAFLSDLQLNSLTDLPPLTDLGALVLPDVLEQPESE
ncbi:segregation and condensation protein B, partial [Kingella kingae]|nr:segregation and condensation protein B [Kingella kingae]